MHWETSPSQRLHWRTLVTNMPLIILLVLADPSELVISSQQVDSRQIETGDYADAQLVSHERDVNLAKWEDIPEDELSSSQLMLSFSKK
jgi:hypothetical protein